MYVSMISKKKCHKDFVVLAFYHFIQIDDVEILKISMKKVCEDNKIIGTILLAEEGINATIAGGRAGIDNLLSHLKVDIRFSNLVYKESFTKKKPFKRLKVKTRNEIVSMGIPNTDPKSLSGIRVDAHQWNQLIQDPDVITIDTRNEYECEIGSFKNAVSPGTKTFREFPGFVDKALDPEKHNKVAMFCTGGIRCEKATHYLLKKGFKEVYQLDGGILKYLETVNHEESLWHGECFVFDDRVTVDKNLGPGSFKQCSACRRPLSAKDRESPNFVQGISCPHCYGKISVKKLSALKERQHQIELRKIRKNGTIRNDKRN
ncbi:MAG: hypothetical protein CMM83_05415 [Rhodospirillales bacterium]|mgnify:CR=1 FL=1|nr:hypothetical protein [Rhodospirillales bacterium]